MAVIQCHRHRLILQAADVWNDAGSKADSYASTYAVEYALVQRPNGSWRIYRALVLGR